MRLARLRVPFWHKRRLQNLWTRRSGRPSDTPRHACLDLVSVRPNKLLSAALGSIRQASQDGEVLVSAISVRELFRIVTRGRLDLSVAASTLVDNTRADSRFRLVPIDVDIAGLSTLLPDVHRDPADQIILATARRFRCPIITRDRRFAEYTGTSVVW